MWLALAFAAPDLDRLDEALARAEAAGVLYGEVLVVDGTTEVYRRRFGGAPQGGRYRIGSVSKSITSGAVLSLVEEGLLSLDQPVVSVVPELVEMADPPVTLRHLLSHSSGFGPMQVGPFAREPSFDELLPALRASQLLTPHAAPGVAHQYSNGGYQILSEVVRRTTQQSFDQSVQAHVLQPAGMVDTALHEGWNEVYGTLYSPLGLIPARASLPGWIGHDVRWDLGGDGAFTSTTDDMVRWARALREGTVLSADTVEVMTTPVLDDYGMGWVVQGDRVWHNGALSPVGAYAYVRWSKRDERVVVLLNAVDLSSVQPELRGVVEAALAGEEGPTVVGVNTFAGILAMLSWLYAPWVASLGLLAGLAGWVRRPGRSRLAVALAGLMALGLTVGMLGMSGLLGMGAATMGTAAVVAPVWRKAVPGRPKGWLPLAIGAALVASAGFGFAWLMVLMRWLIADPWSFMEMVGS